MNSNQQILHDHVKAAYEACGRAMQKFKEEGGEQAEVELCRCQRAFFCAEDHYHHLIGDFGA